MSAADHELYGKAWDMMDLMVKSSQRSDPDEDKRPQVGNLEFIEEVGGYLRDAWHNVRRVNDPDHPNRGLLVVEFGDPNGEQSLAAISHSDVVSVEGQDWRTDPFRLTERDGLWFGRGVADTHGSGVAMLLAGSMPSVIDSLKAAKRRVSVIFTSDEEAPDSYWSYRGAKLAAGDFGVDPTVTSKYFIAGEPTENEHGDIVANRAHKGRWLSRYTVTVANPGHSAEPVDNALKLAIQAANDLIEFGDHELRFAVESPIASIFTPRYSTLQINGGKSKDHSFSITPSDASFVVDIRLLPDFYHDERVKRAKAIIRERLQDEPGVKFDIELGEEFKGTRTLEDSPIVIAATSLTGLPAEGFNGGDEGEVMRGHGKEGITLGPGEFRYAHQPNEQLNPASLLKAVDIYAGLFKATADF